MAAESFRSAVIWPVKLQGSSSSVSSVVFLILLLILDPTVLDPLETPR